MTLVWADGGRCQAKVTELADEITCGTSRFRHDAHDRSLFPAYVEITDEAKRS